MSSQRDPSYVDNLLDGNKDETEVPIGEVREIEARGHAMWRCRDCGEMGKIGDRLPEQCPECAGAKEGLFYWEED